MNRTSSEETLTFAVGGDIANEQADSGGSSVRVEVTEFIQRRSLFGETGLTAHKVSRR